MTERESLARSVLGERRFAAARSLVRTVCIRSYVYRYPEERPDVDSPDERVDVRPITPAVIESHLTSSQRKAQFTRLLEQGHEGLIAVDDGEWLSYGWIHTPTSTTTPSHLPEWLLDLDLYWMFYDRTREAYRRQGWHKYLLAERVRTVLERERDVEIFTDTVAENPSRYSMCSVGFEPDGELLIYRVGHPAVVLRRFGRWDPTAPHPPLPAST